MGRIAGVSPNETRERLINAAANVFEAKGYERATVAEIAREAGVTTGAIYAHYSGKAELLVDAIRENGERATATLFDSGTVSGASATLQVLADRLLSRNDSEYKLLIEALLAARRDAEVNIVISEALADNVELMRTLLDAGQKCGDLIAEVDTRAAAHFMLMVGLGSMLMNDLELPEIDRSDWSTFMHRMIGAFTRPPDTHTSFKQGTNQQGAMK